MLQKMLRTTHENICIRGEKNPFLDIFAKKVTKKCPSPTLVKIALQNCIPDVTKYYLGVYI